MGKLKRFLGRIRLVYRRSTTLTKCVVIAAILLSTAALLALRFSILEAKQQIAALRAEAAVLEQENGQLEENIGSLDTVEGIKKIAYQILGLVDPGAVIFEPEQD